jgi:hypothetical protein
MAILAWCAANAPVSGDVVVQADETPRSGIEAGAVVNHGSIIGEAAARLVFGAETRITGGGYFENTLVEGIFAPGNSPGITTGTNQAFGSTATVEIELGRLTPGFGAGNHDQINDTAAIFLIGGPTLSLLPFGGFVPAPGDEFTILTW